MADQEYCPQCGMEQSEDSPEGLCPRCLVMALQENESDIEANSLSPLENPGMKIGHYRLLELIGEGGMGLVYLAEQQEPVQRKVALKIVKLGMDTRQVVARFEAERQTLAVLEHPNIAHVFDAGTTETGRPYFVMEHVQGRSITKYCDEQTLSVEQRLELFQQVCEGVHHAHQKGIIHRDLKPSNILVAIHGNRAVPKIIDFGIAKAITQPLTEKTSYTEHGQLLGTPEYMSPEQAEMAYQDVDTRSDIYSLGVLLYELLAGATPFDTKRLRKGGIDHIQQIICSEEPRTPSARLTSLGDKGEAIAERRRTQIITLTRRLHRELEWIPMKAMRKDRTRRYRSASELSDDIQNYLTGAPLLAGPESNVYRARKFVRKHAGSVTSAALVAVVVVLGLITSTAFSFSAEEARGEEAAARKQAEQARTVADEQSEEYRRLLYVHRIALADASYREGNVKRTQKLLEACPNDLRGWEWNRLNHISDQSIMTIGGAGREVRSAILSPDEKFIVSSGWGPTIKLWDAEHGTELKTLSGHEDNVLNVALSPDGKQIASGGQDKTVRLWDVETGSEMATLRGHAQGVWSVRFSPDGKRIASAEYWDVIKIWDRTTGKEMINIQTGQYVNGLAFSPDGRHMAAGGNGEIRVWDADSGAEVMTIAAAHRDWVMYVAYSPDGKNIVSCGGWDPRIRIWDAATGEETMSMRTRSRWLNYVNYDRSGKYIVSGGTDNAIDTWDAASGENLMTLRGHHRPIRSAVFSADGSRIISSGDDQTIKLWDISSSPEEFFIQTPSTIVKDDSKDVGIAETIWFSPDGRRFATAGPTWAALTLWDAMTGVELRRLGNTAVVHACAFSPDGKHIVLAEGNQIVRVWDAETGEQRTVFRGHDSEAHSVAYSPDGKRIASSSRKIIRIWDAATGAELTRLEDEKASISSLTYSPDGLRLISCGGDNIIRVWDVASGKRILAIEMEDGAKGRIAISHDGKLIASGGIGEIRVWNATNGRQFMTLRGHYGTVEAVSFSPVADRLVSCSREDGTVKVWDTKTDVELMTLVGEDVYHVAFSPDGSTIVALCREGIILWEMKEPVGGLGPRRNAQAVRQLVRRLHQEHGVYDEVMEQLSGDDTLDESVREMALQVVDSRMPQEACDVAWNVITTIVPFEKNIQEYQAALVKLEKANRLVPDEPFILKALGAVQCRLGSYKDALKTLAKSAQLHSDLGDKFDPVGVAFRAMALHGIGQIEEAKAALVQLREQLNRTGPGWRWGVPIFEALLPELEGLIEGTEP
jgi:eukaryotic-like serine/threonine-protein kinase